MKPINIFGSDSWFQVLQTSPRSQTAVMTLAPGHASGPHAEAHEDSEQTLFLVEGKLTGEIAGEKVSLRRGDCIVIPPGVKHRFSNEGAEDAVTFNVYTPPEYSSDEKG